MKRAVFDRGLGQNYAKIEVMNYLGERGESWWPIDYILIKSKVRFELAF